MTLMNTPTYCWLSIALLAFLGSVTSYTPPPKMRHVIAVYSFERVNGSSGVGSCEITITNATGGLDDIRGTEKYLREKQFEASEIRALFITNLIELK